MLDVEATREPSGLLRTSEFRGDHDTDVTIIVGDATADMTLGDLCRLYLLEPTDVLEIRLQARLAPTH